MKSTPEKWKAHEKHLKSEKHHFSQKTKVLFTKSTTFHMKSTFHENQQNQVNMCVYMHHLHIHAPHAPPNTIKIKIYLVGLPSVLYEGAGQNERSVLNQLFLLLFKWFSWKMPLFMWKAHEKRRFSYERPFARNCNPMFYLLDYVTRRSEKLRLVIKKKLHVANLSDTL